MSDSELRAQVATGGVENTMTADYVRAVQAWHSGTGDDDGTFSVTTNVARHTEGVGSFVEGAFYGGFSDNDSWSATAGQIVAG